MNQPLRFIIVAAVFWLALSPGSTTHADPTDWLKKGTDLLRGATSSVPGAGLSESEIGDGLREALRVGTSSVVSQLGAADGFNADPVAHIPLPESMERVQSTLDKLGMASMLNDLELKLNRAAEAATPKAKALFVDAIQQMTLDDVQSVYKGPDDAATRYFEGKMSAPLREQMRPIVDSTLAEVGAIAAYESVMGQYQKVPFVPDVRANLSDHVLDGGLKAIFHYVAEEEKAIRQDPAKRTTELLRRVFGS